MNSSPFQAHLQRGKYHVPCKWSDLPPRVITVLMRKVNSIYLLMFLCFISCSPNFIGKYRISPHVHFIAPTIVLNKDGTFVYIFPEGWGDEIDGTWSRQGNELKLESDSFLPTVPDTMNIYAVYHPDSMNWIEVEFLYANRYFGNKKFKQSGARYCHMFRIDNGRLLPLNDKGEWVTVPFYKQPEKPQIPDQKQLQWRRSSRNPSKVYRKSFSRQ